LDDAQTTNSMDEVIKDVLFKYPNKPFQLGGDGDGLGFILDIWKSDDDIMVKNQLTHFSSGLKYMKINKTLTD
jgi:hypothetical protein